MKLLQKNESRLAHTLLSTGTFLGFDLSDHTAIFYDQGKNLFSGTTLPTIGKAVVAVLHHPELTQNKRIYIADATFTQQQALTLFEKYTGTTWTVKQVTTEDSFKEGAEAYAKGDIARGVHAYIMALVYNGQGAAQFADKTSNDALGLQSVPLEQIVKEAVKRNLSRQIE